MTPEEEIAALEASLSPDVVDSIRKEVSAPKPEDEIAALEAQLSPETVQSARQETGYNISIPTDEAGNATGEGGPLSDIAHGVKNVANASVRDTADFAMSLFDIPLWGALKAGEMFTNTPMEELDAIDKKFDFSDRISDILDYVGVTPQQPARSDLEQGSLNLFPPLAAGATTLGAASPAMGINTAQKYMRAVRPDIFGNVVGAGVESAAQSFLGEREDKSAEIAGAVAALVAGGAREIYESGRDLVGTLGSGGNVAKFNRGQRGIAAEATQQAIGRDPGAVGRVEDAVQSPAFQSLPEDAQTYFTSGQLSESRGVQELERRIIMQHPEARRLMEEDQISLQNFLKEQLRKQVGTDVRAEEFIATYLKSSERAIDRLTKLKEDSLQRWSDVLKESPPSEYDFGSPLKEIMLENRKLGRDIERDFWEAVDLDDLPKDHPAVKNVFKAVKDVMAEAGEGDAALDFVDFPDPRLIALFDSWKDRPAIAADSLINVRSKFLDAGAKAAAEQNDSLARRNYKIADALLETLISGDPKNLNDYDRARNFSKEFHDTFSRDIIAPLLGTTKNRGSKVASQVVLERLVQPGGQGRANMIALKGASGFRVPKVAEQGIIQDFMRKAGVYGMKEPNDINVKAMENWREQHLPLLEEAGMTNQIDNFIAIAGREKASFEEAAKATGIVGKTLAAETMTGYGSNADGLSTYISTLFGDGKKNPGDELAEMFDSFDIMSAEDISPQNIGIAHQGLKSAVVEGLFKKIFDRTTDKTAMNPRIDTRDLGGRMVAALEKTGQWSPDEIERIAGTLELFRLQHAGNPLRVKDAAGGSRLPGEVEAAFQSSILSRVGSYLALKYVVPGISKNTGPAKLKLAADASKLGSGLGKWLSEHLGKKYAVEGAGDLILQSIYDKQLWSALAKDVADLTDADVTIIRSAFDHTQKAARQFAKSVATGTVKRGGVGSRVLEAITVDPQEQE